MNKRVGVAILGLGVVGGGTYKTLVNHREFYLKTQNVDIVVEAVLDKNLARLKELGVPDECIAGSIAEVVTNPNVDIVIETIGGVGIAKEFVLAALKEGKSVVTANKEMISKCSHELERMAKRNSCGLYYEASCVGGVPIIRTLHEGMQANKISCIKGIINGTTNYILTKMANEGSSYEEALKQAQELGYAEFNPTADVEGFDATYKLSILSSLAFNTKVCIENVYREGITQIKKEDISLGSEFGYTLKLLGIGKDTENGIEVRVHPTFVPSNSPLASVNDSFNAVYIVGDSVGEIMLYGRGAGALPTGSAIVSDVIFAIKHEEYFYAPFKNDARGNKATKFAKDFTSQYYIRLAVKDEAGVLSKVSGSFSKFGVSIKEVKQIACENGEAQIVIITHMCAEKLVKQALNKIAELPVTHEIKGMIRIEE